MVYVMTLSLKNIIPNIFKMQRVIRQWEFISLLLAIFTNNRPITKLENQKNTVKCDSLSDRAAGNCICMTNLMGLDAGHTWHFRVHK